MVGGGGIGTTQACGRGEGRKGGPGQEIQEFSPEGVDGGGVFTAAISGRVPANGVAAIRERG